jgi:hypothetical protein
MIEDEVKKSLDTAKNGTMLLYSISRSVNRRNLGKRE